MYTFIPAPFTRVASQALRHAVPGLLALMLSACADDDILEQPVELTPFESSRYLERLWYSPVGTGPDEQYVFLQPLKLSDKLVMASRDGVLTVISTEGGDQLGTVELDTTLSAGIGGDEDIWLVATRDAQVIAVDAESSTELWRTRVPTEVLARPQRHQDRNPEGI